MSKLGILQPLVRGIQSGRAGKLLRRFGCWKGVQQMLNAPPTNTLFPACREVAAGPKASALTLSAYRESIDRFNASQPNKELLDGIRAYNHKIVDNLNATHPLRGTLLLDVGASPHGYALERALEGGVTLYVGVGLDVSRPEYVVSDRGSVGMLLRTDATSLQFPTGMFDLVLSISTLEPGGGAGRRAPHRYVRG